MGWRQAPIGWHLPEFRPLARSLVRPRWIASPWKARPRTPLAGMQVQVQVRDGAVPKTPLYKAV